MTRDSGIPSTISVYEHTEAAVPRLSEDQHLPEALGTAERWGMDTRPAGQMLKQNQN